MITTGKPLATLDLKTVSWGRYSFDSKNDGISASSSSITASCKQATKNIVRKTSQKKNRVDV